MDRIEYQPQDDYAAFIDELILDETFNASVRLGASRSLRIADDWGMPLGEREVRTLMATDRSLWESVAEGLEDRWQDVN